MLQDFYTKLSDQEKKVLYIALGFIVLAVFDFLFLQPVSTKLKTLDKDIEQTKSDIKRDVRFLSYQDKIFKEDELYRVYQTDDQKTEEEIIAAFLKTIENLGTEAEVTLGKLNPAESVPKKGYVQYFANVECNGKLENIIKFIHKIDTTPNLLKVVKMNIVGKKSSADEVTVAMKISKLIIDAKSRSGNLSPEDAALVNKNLPVSNGMKSVAGSPAGKGVGTKNESGKISDNTSGGSVGAEGIPQEGKDAAGSEVGSGGGAGGGSTGSGEGGGVGPSPGGGSGGSGGGAGADSRNGKGGARDGSGGGGGASGDAAGDEVDAEQGGGGGAGGADASGSSEEGGGESGAAGAGAKNSKATKGKDSKKAKEQKPVAENKPKDESKKPAPLKDVTTGERVKVTGIEELWNNFWGIKPKNEGAPTEKTKVNPDDYKAPDEVKANLWERMLDRKSK